MDDHTEVEALEQKKEASADTTPSNLNPGPSAGPAWIYSESLPNGDTSVLNMPVDTLALVPITIGITRIGRLAYNSMMLLAQSMESDNEGFFSAPLNRIVIGFDSSSNNHNELKRHLRSMVGNVVEWQSATKGESEWGACALLSECRLSKKNGENWLKWAYPPTIRSQVMNPSRWAQYNTLSAAQLNTHCAVVLYGICARYKDNVGGLTAKQHWEWWVPVLTGSPAKRVLKTQYRFFKRDYLKPAIESINQFTEIEIAVKEIKNGRSIESIQFTVKKKTVESLKEKKGPTDVRQYLRAIALGIDDLQAEELSVKFGELALAEALDRMEKQLKLHGIGNRLSYLKAVLKNVSEGYQAPNTSPKVRDQSNTKSKTMSVEDAFLSGGKDTAGTTTEEGGFINPLVKFKEERINTGERLKLVRLTIEAMSEDERNKLLDELYLATPDTIVTKRLRELMKDRDWQRPRVMAEMVKFYEAKTLSEEGEKQ